LQKSLLTHSVTAPFQIEPAVLGFDLVLGANLNADSLFIAQRQQKDDMFRHVVFLSGFGLAARLRIIQSLNGGSEFRLWQFSALFFGGCIYHYSKRDTLLRRPVFYTVIFHC